MDYTPEIGHTVVFADTYASDVEYNVTAVEDNRVTVSLTNPHEGYDAVSINMTFDVAREMGIARIGASGTPGG